MVSVGQIPPAGVLTNKQCVRLFSTRLAKLSHFPEAARIRTGCFVRSNYQPSSPRKEERGKTLADVVCGLPRDPGYPVEASVARAGGIENTHETAGPREGNPEILPN